MTNLQYRFQGFALAFFVVGAAMTLNDLPLWLDPGPASTLTIRVTWTSLGAVLLLLGLLFLFLSRRGKKYE